MSSAGVALDIGGTKLLSALSRAPDRPVHRATDTESGPESLFAQVLASVRTWGSEAGPRVVVASAGRLDYDRGVVLEAANLPWQDFPLVARLAAETESEVSLVGDASAAAVAELGHPDRRHHQIGAYVTVSTGIGLGLVRNGRLDWEEGHDAMELGHRTVESGQEALECGCGRRGCLEAYSSGNALLRRYADLRRQAGERAWPVPRVSDLVQREATDPIAKYVVEDALTRLSRALVDVLDETGARVLVLGGGVMHDAGLFDRVRARMSGAVEVAIEPALHGGLSAVHGAAALCERESTAMLMVSGGRGWA